jgi:hypothetical protein
MSRPSGRGTPLRASSPRCCNERRPGSGSPHPPRRGGSPIRPSLMRQAWTVGPRSGRRCAHQRGSLARSRHPRPDGLVRVSPLRSRLEEWARRAGAIAGLMTGVAWLIPYCCARHHPLHLEDNGCRGSACSPLSGQEGRRPQTARVRRAHHPPLPGPINPVCATREHVRPPALQAPLVTFAVRKHGGLAWPPRLTALRQPRRLFREITTYTKAGRAVVSRGSREGLVVATGPPVEQLQPFQRQERSHFLDRARLGGNQ